MVRPQMGHHFPHLQNLRKSLGFDTRHAYEGLSICLPSGHQLPTYQQSHRLYDRFLPHLAAYLEPQSVVVDVGANCGDTLAAMLSTSDELQFICIEPDDEFIQYLTKNVEEIRKVIPGISVQVDKSFVGKAVTTAALTGSGGSRHAIASDQAVTGHTLHSAQTLDCLIAKYSVESVRLLKSDVDGYDFDVIDSAFSTIEKCLPLLYFECQLDHDFQKHGYEATLNSLAALNYRYWAIFDNFGELILETDDVSMIMQLLDYTWRLNCKRSTRTIYYLDIFSSHNGDMEFARRVIQEYLHV